MLIVGPLSSSPTLIMMLFREKNDRYLLPMLVRSRW